MRTKRDPEILQALCSSNGNNGSREPRQVPPKQGFRGQSDGRCRPKFAFPAQLHYKTDVRSSAYRLTIWAILLAIPAGCAWAQTGTSSPLQEAQSQPQRLVREASEIELNQGYGRRPYLFYQFHKQTEHLNRLQAIYETQDGDVACRLATDGHALTDADWQTEQERLLQLQRQPELEKHRQRHELEDVRHFEKFLGALPDAFDYSYAGQVQAAGGEVLRLKYVPHHGYHPSDYEKRLLRNMQGEIWIDARQKRIVYFHGELFRDVVFGWGILGTIQKGGTLTIQQTEAAPNVWAMSELKIDITGRALLVKRVQAHVLERTEHYQLAQPVQSYQQAVDFLLQTRCGTQPDAIQKAKTSAR
jgi:hypothetical protein